MSLREEIVIEGAYEVRCKSAYYLAPRAITVSSRLSTST